jgi:hypothetical protein
MYKSAVYVFCALDITNAPDLVAVRSNAWVWGRSLLGIAGSNPASLMDFCLLWVLCVVRKRSLRRADHSSRGVLSIVLSLTECDRESSTMRRPWSTGGCCVMVQKKILPMRRFRWPRGLKRRSCWNCGLESRVWAGMSVCCECCVLCSYRFLSVFLLVKRFIRNTPTV